MSSRVSLGFEASRRFVEEEQLGIAAKRPSNFETSLVAVGQVLGGFLRLIIQADELEQGHSFFASLYFFLLDSGQAQDTSEKAGFHAAMLAYHDVLERRHVGEKADILEGACNAE